MVQTQPACSTPRTPKKACTPKTPRARCPTPRAGLGAPGARSPGSQNVPLQHAAAAGLCPRPSGGAASGAASGQQTPRQVVEPRAWVAGSKVEYYSGTNKCWMPVRILQVDAETGFVTLDVKPQSPLDLREQKARLRPRTRPSQEQLEWVRAVLREGRLHTESSDFFLRHARQGGQGDGTGTGGSAEGATGSSSSGGGAQLELLRLNSGDAFRAGLELDERLGTAGAVCYLRYQIEQVHKHALSEDDFEEVFWNILWNVQKEFGQALPRERSLPTVAVQLEDVYDLEETLGSGTYGVVRLATKKVSGVKRAVKAIQKDERFRCPPGELLLEIEHLLLLDHPHIVRLYEHYEDNDHVFLVMDFCSGGDLQSAISRCKTDQITLPEAFVASVMKQILMATAHVHSRGVVHLDMKAANVMLMPSNRRTLPPARQSTQLSISFDETPHIMVIDFGVAQIFRPGDFKNCKPIGTPATMAPEAWKGEFTPKADVFSCGVVLFELLSLQLPFRPPCDTANARKFWIADPTVPWDRLQFATTEATRLCRKMLALDRASRPTAAQCLQESFLQRGEEVRRSSGVAASTQIPRHLAERLANAPRRSILHHSVALTMARAWPPNQLPTVKALFHKLDEAGAGRLSQAVLRKAMEKSGISKTRATEAVEAMDLDRNDTIDWTEFVAACIDVGSPECEEDLRQLFNKADSDGDGLLSQQDISSLLCAEHLRRDVASDVFADIVGRREEGARLDWPTFHGHFRLATPQPQAKAKGTSAVAARPQHNFYAPQPATVEVLAQAARDFFERASDFFWWPSTDCSGNPPEEKLRLLHDMGFTDRERNVAVLRRNRNEMGHRVFEELLRQPTSHIPL